MKIAVWHNLPSGGGKRALYSHVRGLVERGHEVECWCPSSADRSYLPLSELAPEHVIPLTFANPRRSAAVRAVLYYVNALRLRGSMRVAAEQFAREVGAKRFDVVFANSCHFYAAPYVTRFGSLPTVVYLQEPFRRLYEAQPGLPWVWSGAVPAVGDSLPRRLARSAATGAMLPVLRLRAREEWHSIHAADRVLVNSFYSRESVLRAYGVDARVCYLGIDTSLFRSLDLERERFVIGLGSFEAKKGIGLAIRSVARLETPRPPLVWVANVVDRGYHDQMIRLAESLHVELDVRVSIPDAELVSLLNRATIMLYTSRLEPFGFAPLEANACGVPVVAVAEGGVRETIRDGVNGLLVESDEAKIGAALASLLSDPARARRMGHSGAEYVQREWTVAGSIDRLEAHLEEMVQS